jgi:hypothetical protein
MLVSTGLALSDGQAEASSVAEGLLFPLSESDGVGIALELAPPIGLAD